MVRCGECGQELPSPDTHHTYEDCMKYELTEATRLLVKHQAWEIAKQVIDYIRKETAERILTSPVTHKVSSYVK